MGKRQASEALEELTAADSPASKRSRLDDYNKSLTPPSATDLDDEVRLPGGQQTLAHRNGRVNGENGLDRNGNIIEERQNEGGDADRGADGGVDADGGDLGEEEEEEEEEAEQKAPIRQAAPTEGYDDLYLDTIDRNVLDFDFEKLCSVSLSNINVYACLVCGRYYQGRGPRSHAYFHALEEDHHVFIHMENQRVYVLPEGYEVKSKSLDDIKFVSDPRYTRHEVADMDRKPRKAWTLAKKEYAPGFVGMNNIKENEYFNVVVQALSHVSPLRNFMLLEDLSRLSSKPSSTTAGRGTADPSFNASSFVELVRRTSALFRKIWNPRAFKAHVSPHELLQEVALRSNKRFTLTAQSDPVDFLSWFLNHLHLGLGGSRTKPGSSVVQRVFQGRLRVESQAITARADATNDRLRFEESAEVKSELTRFLLLTLDLPAAPLFQDEQERNIIPQVPLPAVMAKYNGTKSQELAGQRRRYRLVHPLPPFLALHVKRFSRNKFVSERNPTIVTFEPRGLDVGPYVEPDPAHAPPGEPILYDLVANVVHEAVRAADDVAGGSEGAEERRTWKVQLRNKATDEWVVAQDLFVDKIRSELLYLGETYLQIWERRREPGTGTGKGKGKGKGMQ